MKILALEVEAAETIPADFQPHVKAEALRVWELLQQDVIREVYFRADEHTAVLVLECEDMDEAQSILDTMPLVREGLISFQLIPLAPYPGFARLFVDLP